LSTARFPTADCVTPGLRQPSNPRHLREEEDVQTETTVLGFAAPGGAERDESTRRSPVAGAEKAGMALSLRFKMLSGLAILLFISLLAAAYISVLWLPIIGPSGNLAAIIVTLAAVYAFVLVLAGDYLLSRLVLRPVEAVVEGTERIAAGDDSYELSGGSSREMRRLAASVNAMTAKLMSNQQTLARNIESLDETNRALVEARSELVQAEKLATLGMLAAGIAHEIGNPLGAILGYLELARRRGPEEAGWTDEIRVEAERIDRIIRALLDYARPRSASLRPIDIRSTIESTLELLELQGQLKGVELEKRMTGSPPSVHADPTHLQQLLVNLMLNARDALEGIDDPTIRIEVAETTYEASGRGPAPRRANDPKGVDYSHLRRLEALNEGTPKPAVALGTPMARITIADNGTGIADEEKSRVFEPFYTTKEPGRGTGLGLAVSARLVEAMRGDIYVERGIGQGAAFTVLLPVSTNRVAP